MIYVAFVTSKCSPTSKICVRQETDKKASVLQLLEFLYLHFSFLLYFCQRRRRLGGRGSTLLRRFRRAVVPLVMLAHRHRDKQQQPRQKTHDGRREYISRREKLLIPFNNTMTIPLFVFVCLSSMRQRRQEPPLSIARLNRLLLERSEISCGDDVVLASNDDRAVHVREQIWRSKQSEKIPDATLRVGVVNGGVVDDCRARLSANGDVILDGRVLRELGDEEAVRPRLDLVLALPAPLRLKRILPMVSSLGIDSLYLVGTQRSDRAFFGSSLLRGFQTYKKNDLDFAPVQAPLGTDFRNLLIEGAEQSGSTAIPHVAVVSSLSTALRNLPGDDENCVRCAAHPDRGDGFRALDDRTGEVRRYHIVSHENRIIPCVVRRNPEIPENISRYLRRRKTPSGSCRWSRT